VVTVAPLAGEELVGVSGGWLLVKTTLISSKTGVSTPSEVNTILCKKLAPNQPSADKLIVLSTPVLKVSVPSKNAC